MKRLLLLAFCFNSCFTSQPDEQLPKSPRNKKESLKVNLYEYLYELKVSFEQFIYPKERGEFISIRVFHDTRAHFRNLPIECVSILKNMGDVSFIRLFGALIASKDYSEFWMVIGLCHEIYKGTIIYPEARKHQVSKIFESFDKIIWKILNKEEKTDLKVQEFVSSKEKLESLLSLLTSIRHNISKVHTFSLGFGTPRTYIEVTTLLVEELGKDIHLQLVDIYFQLETLSKQLKGKLPDSGPHLRKILLLCTVFKYCANQAVTNGPFEGVNVEAILRFPRLLACIITNISTTWVTNYYKGLSDPKLIESAINRFENSFIKPSEGKGHVMNKITILPTEENINRQSWFYYRIYSILHKYKNINVLPKSS
jgi:hypothetical protein